MESYYARKPPLSPASAASAAASPRALQQLESEFGPDVARRVHLTRAFTQLRDELGEAGAAVVAAEVEDELSPPRFAGRNGQAKLPPEATVSSSGEEVLF